MSFMFSEQNQGWFNAWELSIFESNISKDTAPGGVTWVNFGWVCAAGLSEPLPYYSLFCG